MITVYYDLVVDVGDRRRAGAKQLLSTLKSEHKFRHSTHKAAVAATKAIMKNTQVDGVVIWRRLEEISRIFRKNQTEHTAMLTAIALAEHDEVEAP